MLLRHSLRLLKKKKYLTAIIVNVNKLIIYYFTNLTCLRFVIIEAEDVRMRGINLTSLSEGPYEMDSGQSVTWTVLIDVLIDALKEEDHLSIRWSIADNEIISNSSLFVPKYQTVTEHNQTSLTVHNLCSNDTAVYHLTVSLGNHKQSLSFTLKIRGLLFLSSLSRDFF